MIVSIVVTYNGINWYEKCFGSLFNSTISSEIIVIDNGSTDNSVKYIKGKYPEIHLIENKENLGFAKANNIGIKYALDKGADFVFLLNQDAWVGKDTIGKLLKVFEHSPDAGIVSPIHLNGSGKALDKNFTYYISDHITPHFVSDLYLGKQKPFYKTTYVNAAAWLMSKSCIEKVGGFDTSLFFHYGEDDNYCQRVIYHKFGIYISTETSIYHDRELRNGEETEKNENRIQSLRRKIYYGELSLDDSIVEKEILNLKRRYKRKFVKYLFSLKIRELFKLREFTRDEISFFSAVEQSRKKNKKGGLVWLY